MYSRNNDVGWSKQFASAGGQLYCSHPLHSENWQHISGLCHLPHPVPPHLPFPTCSAPLTEHGYQLASANSTRCKICWRQLTCLLLPVHLPADQTPRRLSCPAEYGCYHPLRDVLTPPFEWRSEKFMNASLTQGLDEALAAKKS